MADRLQLFLERIDTPIGELLLVADREKNLRAVDWAEYDPRTHRFLRLHYGEDGYGLGTGHESKPYRGCNEELLCRRAGSDR